MNIWDIDKLFLFIAFVIPGFISIKIYELMFPSTRNDSSKQLIDAITYSCINYAVLSWPILEVEGSNLAEAHPSFYKFFYAFVLFIFPILLVILWKWIRGWEVFQKNAPHPTLKPWDFVFSQRQWYWVLVTMKDGKKIGGKFANKSFSSSSPAPEQIYLEEAWVLAEDDSFERARRNTVGIMIISDEISTIELFQYN